MLSKALLIGVAGGAGSVARYLLGAVAHRWLGSGFPYGTIAINALGSFLLAVLTHAAVTRNVISADLRLVLGAGVLGGFTTYSTFNQETILLLQRGSILLAAANVAVTVLLCLLAGGLGLMLARGWLGG